MKEWEKQERRLAKRTGGTRNPGSGSGWRRPNDVRGGNSYLWECKQTDAASITLKLADWEKLRRNALLAGFRPAMELQIGKRRLVIFDSEDFLG